MTRSNFNSAGRWSPGKITLVFLFLLLAGFFVALQSGRLPMGMTDVAVMIKNFFAREKTSGNLLPKELVFFLIRVPRCIMAVLIGSSLAVCGAIYQALFRNPLVSPDILGVSAGCTFGAALGLILPFTSFFAVHLLSFGFGIIAVCASIGLARAISIKPLIVLVLAGIVVLSFFNALLMAIKYFSDPYDELPSIVFWVMGSLTRVTWDNVRIMLPLTAVGMGLFILFSFRLNILSLGDVQARSLGMNPTLFRTLLIGASSLMVAAAVATCGQISWIGLVIPHMARNLAGPKHEHMIPLTALLGGLFLLMADTLARSVTAAEIPVGIITALAGAPAFGLIMYRNRRTGWI